ncbi:TPA: hypothetical protein HA278_02045 [Candidatus Woesearchaeota archaeon]|nr:hypothetical protein [archaeon]HIJ10817.1 hypothetical protein [Candidatus Woesearchaeota archaeon]|tara:strand:- start:60 stop:560 length:501 start_codon:yes stop_codon:yes gene_type:complete
MNNNNDNNWAIVGKVGAGLALAAGLTWGAIAGYSGIQESGYKQAERDVGSKCRNDERNRRVGYEKGLETQKNKFRTELDSLSQKGFLLPTDGCLRYETRKEGRENFTRFYGTGKCKGLEFKVSNTNSKVASVIVTLGNYRAGIDTGYNGQTKFKTEVKSDALWKPQ